jgi:serine protease Do
MRLRTVTGAVVVLAATLGAMPTTARGQAKLETISPQDPRRTPVVEVFHRWKQSVVYLTGPIAGNQGPAIEEFFKVPSNRERISIGSGFVVHESGYIVTNAHAVERVITHHATLIDGRTYPAELIGLAREYDLALLKVEAGRPLQPVQLGKSNDFILGETIIVISNPGGLMHTCTTGIISASDRETQPGGLPGITLRGLIQTDASINPGSSGGPWFNVLGEVIGVTTAMKPGSQNIGFGIPVSAVRHTLPEMLDVERQYSIYCGLKMQEQPQEPCAVAIVAPDSPASVAGIHNGDIVKRVNGRTIIGRCEFVLALVGHKAGDVLQLDLLRDDRPLAVSLTLMGRTKPDGALILRQRYGLTAVPLNAAKVFETSLRVNRGVIITGVISGPPYNKLQNPPMPGDVLARINNIRPRDLDHVGMLLDRVKPGEAVHFVLLRMKDNVATRVDMTLTLAR